MTSAAASALHIPELLERILLSVNPRTVILAQRVNKTFHGTIRGSRKLQVKLCFRQTSFKRQSRRDKRNKLLLSRDMSTGDADWILEPSFIYLPHYSSALRMYPSSRPRHEFWEDIIGMNMSGTFEGGRARFYMKDETLQQFLRRLMWVGRSSRWVEMERKRLREEYETSEQDDDE